MAERSDQVTLDRIREQAALGQLDAAEASCQELVQSAPQEPEAWAWWGLLMSARARWPEAEAALREAIRLLPQNSHYWSYLSAAVRAQGRAAEAEGWARQAIAVDPRQPTYWSNLGATLADQKSAEAIQAFRQAVALNPHDAAAWQGLACAEQALGNLDAAQQAFERSLTIAPDGEAIIGYAHLLSERGQRERAIVALQAFLARAAGSAIGWAVLCNIAQKSGDAALTETACRRALQIASLQSPSLLPSVHENLLFMLSYLPGFDAAAIYEEHCRWNERHAAPLARFTEEHTNVPAPGRRLRIGYLSPDFREHCLSFFSMPLLAAHDHAQFEIYCYADVPQPDVTTERLRLHADVWRNVEEMSDDQVCDLIRGDQIDILVDLTMHMERNRLLVFARKPAPVQVCWLAYPGTTGLSAMDYRLTDPYLDPQGHYDRYYSEESIRLPETFWCYDPLTSEPAVNRLPALDKGHITFGCLNNFFKVNEAVLRLWASVLKAVNRSRLILLAPEGKPRDRVLNTLGQAGVAAERIQFVAFQPRPRYLQQYHQIDIGLDTFPYNGHTTSLDAYWMGVPIVTLVGQTVVGRAGVSQLTNLGLPELIAETPEQYVRIAGELAGDLPRLGELRSGLRERLQRSPLMDAARFALNIEAAYRQMWQRWCSLRARM